MPRSLWHRACLPTYLAFSLSFTHNASTLPRQPALFLTQAFARSHYPHPVCALSFSTVLGWVLARPTLRFSSVVLACCYTLMSCLHTLHMTKALPTFPLHYVPYLSFQWVVDEQVMRMCKLRIKDKAAFTRADVRQGKLAHVLAHFSDALKSL